MAGRNQEREKPDFHFVVGDHPPNKPATEQKEPFWKNRTAAVALVAVMIVLGTLFGVRRSLNQASADVLEAFYVGTDESGYGIATDLNKIDEFAGNLVTIANKYDDAFAEETAAVTEARTELSNALAEDADAAACYAANRALTEAIEALNAAMEDYDLSDSDEEYRSELYASIASRNTIIAHEATDYNSEIRDYNSSILGAFPVNVLKGLVGADELEEYG